MPTSDPSNTEATTNAQIVTRSAAIQAQVDAQRTAQATFLAARQALIDSYNTSEAAAFVADPGLAMGAPLGKVE